MVNATAERRLVEWWHEQLPDADDVRVEDLDRIEVGHSADMLLSTLVWRAHGGEHRQEVVLRLRPPEPGLLEPYDLTRQFGILQALDRTEVRAPRALWLEPTGDVLGRPFLVMERLDGDVYEMEVPADVDAVSVRRMTESLVDQLAVIHEVDLDASGLRTLGDGRNYVARELDRWAAEMRRVRRGPLPALERLEDELRRRQPPPSSRVTLVHGDAKPGNFAFLGDEVSAVFDWELTDVGDPLADVGYLEMMWAMPVGLASRPGALTADELVARYEERTGTGVGNRGWYRSFQAFKLAVIMLLGSMLVDAGHSDDVRLVAMAVGVPLMTHMGLRDLGVDEELADGPVAPRDERLAELRGSR